MQIDLSGRVVVITGAARAIGAQLARRFAAEGVRLVLLDRDAEGLDAMATELVPFAEVFSQTCDVSDPDIVQRVFAAAATRFGSIDVLINNAGIAREARVHEHSLVDWEQTFAINMRGTFLCSQAALPWMKQAGWGRILNASSFAAVIPSVGFAAYAASKSAIISFTRVLAAEVGPWGITANAYIPGMVPTPMNGFEHAPEARQRQLLDTLALRRWGSADDIASLLIFLASDYAGYITGAAIEITGGKFAVQFPQLAYQDTAP